MSRKFIDAISISSCSNGDTREVKNPGKHKKLDTRLHGNDENAQRLCQGVSATNYNLRRINQRARYVELRTLNLEPITESNERGNR
jgi:hypothetical protein